MPLAVQPRSTKLNMLYCTQLAGAHSGSDSHLLAKLTSFSNASDRSSFTISSSQKWPYRKLMRSSDLIISMNSSSCKTRGSLTLFWYDH
uniref:Uncharacterized protein n=1 Tax=Anopheles minimus TaxID=112268 RepID=A0A182VSX2_9DIPT